MVLVVAVAVAVVGGCWRYVPVLILDRCHCIHHECLREIELAVVHMQSTVLSIPISYYEL